MPLVSRLFKDDARLRACLVSDPSHVKQGDAGEFVSRIQRALIELDEADIDANELSGGNYGSSTAAAVLAYKQARNIVNRSYQSQPDDIVGKMTISQMDQEMHDKEGPEGSVPVLARTADGRCLVEKAPPFPPPPIPNLNTDVVAMTTSLIPDLRIAIRAANFQLLLADRHVTHQKQKLPTGPLDGPARSSLQLLDRVFDLFKFADPRPAFDNFLSIYRNMDVALNRSFETAPLIAPTLFVANPIPSMESQAAAYTSHGAAFFDDSVTNKFDLPANRIYLCQNLLKPSKLAKMMTLIHELAHFVSGPRFEIVDNHLHGHYFASDPPNLLAPPGSLSPQFQTLPSHLKIRTAEHYAAFAMMAAARRLT